MIRQLLEEVKAAPLDEASRQRLKEIHAASIKELETGLAPELVEELERLSLPFTEDGTPSEGELRIAQAQLVGWLEGLFHGIQTAIYAQQMASRAQLEQIRRALPMGQGGQRPARRHADHAGRQRGAGRSPADPRAACTSDAPSASGAREAAYDEQAEEADEHGRGAGCGGPGEAGRRGVLDLGQLRGRRRRRLDRGALAEQLLDLADLRRVGDAGAAAGVGGVRRRRCRSRRRRSRCRRRARRGRTRRGRRPRAPASPARASPW